MKADTHPTTIRKAEIEGIDGYRLDNGFLRADVLPACGGKIAGLSSPPDNDNWLWRNPHLPVRLPAANGRYIEEHDSGGIDDVFPSIAPGPYPFDPFRGRPLPDHGELWERAWDVTEAAVDAGGAAVLAAECPCRVLPCRFSRRLVLRPGSAALEAKYLLTNLAEAPLSFLWAFHALFPLEIGAQLELPDTDAVDVDPASPKWSGPTGACAWSEIESRFRVGSFDPGAAMAVKFFARNTKGARATWRRSDGSCLTIRFDPAQIPTVAVWANFGAWSGSGSAPYWNIGIEPMIGNCDALNETCEAGTYTGHIGAGATLEWSLTVTIDREEQHAAHDLQVR